MSTHTCIFGRRPITFMQFKARYLNQYLSTQEQAQIFNDAREIAMRRYDSLFTIVRVKEGDSWRLNKVSKKMQEQFPEHQRPLLFFTYAQLAKIVESLKVCEDLDRWIGRALWLEDDDHEIIDQLMGAYASPQMIGSFHRWLKKPTAKGKFIKTLKDIDVRYFITNDVPKEQRDEVRYLLSQVNIQFLVPRFRKKEGVRTFVGTSAV